MKERFFNSEPTGAQRSVLHAAGCQNMRESTKNSVDQEISPVDRVGATWEDPNVEFDAEFRLTHQWRAWALFRALRKISSFLNTVCYAGQS
jgi:hypothetical protein